MQPQLHRPHRLSYERLRGCALVRPVVGIVLVMGLSSFGVTVAAQEMAPDLTLTLYQGECELGAKNVKLSDLRGRPVVLNFWAALCPPCRAEMPEFERFYQEFKNRVWVIGLDVGRFTDLGSQEEAHALLGELGITYATGFTDDESVMQVYEIRGIPTTLFIDAKSEVFLKWHGVVDQDTLTRMTTRMLDR
ncbi:MAG: TlpA family protein disulfide reductase [Acidiferrobacterales bacterium]